MSYRYPADRPSDADFVTFQHKKYSGRGGSGGGGGGAGGSIVLYMPENTPAIGSQQNWNQTRAYAGPLGQLQRAFLDAAVDVSDVDLKNVPGTVSKMVGRFKGLGGNVGPAARQGYLQFLAGKMGRSQNQITSLTKGEIYNPNVEMWYDGPALRSFTFEFIFAPKSAQDNSAAMNIIKEFKKWSSPKDQGQKYEIPHVWDISYSNQHYNKFKTSALVNINVDYNAGLPGHMTFEDGAPIVSAMSLTFTEVELVTQDDHNQGLSGF